MYRILLVLLTLLPTVGHAAVTVNDKEQFAVDVTVNSRDLLPAAELIVDEDGQLTAEKVLSLPAEYREPLAYQSVSFGFTHSAHWFVVPLHNPDPLPVKRMLTFEPTWLDSIAIYVANDSDIKRAAEGGDARPFVQRSLGHRLLNFEIEIPVGASQLLVRTETVDPYLVKMTLWERESYLDYAADMKLYFGFVYGVLLAMLLYNLFLFISIREKVYAAYVFYIAAFLLGHATINGLTYAYLWPASPVWANWAHSVFDYLYVLAGLIFIIYFLELPARHPRLYLWMRVVIAIMVISFVVTGLAGGYDWQVDASLLWVSLFAPLAVALGVVALHAGNQAARWFLSAAIAGAVGSFITAMAVTGVIPFNFYTFRAIDFGMLLDAMLLSLALADRLRLARLENEAAKERLLRTTTRHAEELEKKVAERTRDLQKAIETKDRFLSIVGHDLRGPMTNLKLLFNSMVKTPKDIDEKILEAARNSIQSTSDFLDQLFTWARTQRGEMKAHPELLDASQSIRDVMSLLAGQAESKNIQITMEGQGPHWLYADREMTQTILRNLLNNAIKYSEQDATVQVSVHDDGESCITHIRDSGVGMSEAVREMLFKLDTKPQSSPGTQGEKGSGLGLILCREFVEMNGGEIGVESQKGEGATFWFSLPKAKQAVG